MADTAGHCWGSRFRVATSVSAMVDIALVDAFSCGSIVSRRVTLFACSFQVTMRNARVSWTRALALAVHLFKRHAGLT